jgi:hypothetical protein
VHKKYTVVHSYKWHMAVPMRDGETGLMTGWRVCVDADARPTIIDCPKPDGAMSRVNELLRAATRGIRKYTYKTAIPLLDTFNMFVKF